MHSRNRWIMVALAALVAIALVIIYIYASRGERIASRTAATDNTGVSTEVKTATPPAPPETPGTEIAQSAPSASRPMEPLPAEHLSAMPEPPAAPAPLPEPGPSPSATSGGAQGVLYDLSQLPKPVQRMLEQIVIAAQSGDIEQMRPVLESNELKPMVAATAVSDPIAFWKKGSADGEGRDVLAALLNVVSSGFVRVKEGREEMYVWPYFAETNLATLSPAQVVDLYRILPASQAVPMQRSGKYSYYRVGIASDGVWHYFLQ
ncbi:MAG: hypothetical protein ACXWJN_05245 [Methyloceanibacter sp.]